MVKGITKVGSSMINGDTYFISEDESVLFVADGASGAGEEGKTLMGKLCKQVLAEEVFHQGVDKVEKYIEDVITKMNSRLITASQEKGQLIYGTIALAIRSKNTLWTAAIGDSPMFLKNQDGIMQCSKPRKRYEGMIDQGYITRQEYEGYIKNMHPMMWSCFDVFFPQIVPHYKVEKYSIDHESILYMCCDGISDWVKEEEMFELIQAGKNLEELVKIARDRSMDELDYVDDQTIIIMK